jgi:hypothetical protein
MPNHFEWEGGSPSLPRQVNKVNKETKMRFKIVDVVGKPEYEVDTAMNVRAVAMERGEAVCLDVVNLDGNRISQPVTANLAFFQGVTAQGIPPGDEGPVVRRGITEALVYSDATRAIAVGDVLIPVTGESYLVYENSFDPDYPAKCVAAEVVATTAISTAKLRKVYLNV